MIARLLTVLAFLCLAGAAQAQNVWSVSGPACVPAESATGRYRSGVPFVRHAAGEIGLMVFNCQIDRFNSGTTTWNLRMTYRDTTGSAPAAYIRARLYRMPIGTATPSLIAQVNSNASASTAVNTIPSAQFNHTFDFEANTYWVRVELVRAATNQGIFFYSVVIDGTSV